MVHLAEVTNSLEEARILIKEQITSNKAIEKQNKLFELQGGKLPDLNDFVHVKEIIEINAQEDGHIQTIHALTIGVAAMKLGAGRATKDEDVDPDVGIVLNKKVGDSVKKGELLALVYNNKPNIDDILQEVQDAFVLSNVEVPKKSIIFEIIT